MKHRKRFTKRGFRLKLKKETAFSISQILFFAIAGLILLSFTRQGAILLKFNDLLMNYFSWSAFFLPFIFLSFAFLISKVKFILGQPNVIVGGLLFFLSVMTLGRAGIVGLTAWEGISTPVTGIGAGIILIGTSLVGLIVLFNTSIDQVYKFVAGLFKTAGGFVYGGGQLKVGGNAMSKGPLRVSGGAQAQPVGRAGVSAKGSDESLEQKLVSNVPGEEKIWKYPSLDLLTETETGKADRGDIRDNAAIIEKTLESFGITAHVVEVNMGPAVTQYALEVGLGTKLSKITSLERDLALALSAPTGTIRIEAPIPGRNLVGI